MPLTVAYNPAGDKLETASTFEKLKAENYAYTIPLRVGYCPFHARVHDGGAECKRMQHHRLHLAVLAKQRKDKAKAGQGSSA